MWPSQSLDLKLYGDVFHLVKTKLEFTCNKGLATHLQGGNSTFGVTYVLSTSGTHRQRHCLPSIKTFYL